MAEHILLCPVYHRPLAGSVRLVDGALNVRCKFCGVIHLFSCADLQATWRDLAQKAPTERDPAQSVPAVDS